MSFYALQTSFNGGALSQRLQSRPDVSIYAIGATELLNCAPSIEGALVKRSGTRWRGMALSSASWLSPFIFNATQAYIIEWGDELVRFYTNDTLLEDGGGPVEVVVPYSAEEAPYLSSQQSFDVLYLAHDNHAPAALSRTAADAFNHAALDLAGGPFGDRNRNEAVTVTASATTGSGITITASSGIFQAGHVGARFQIEAQDFGTIEAWQVGLNNITIGMFRRSEGRVYQAATAGTTGTVQPTHEIGSAWDGDTVGQDVNGKGPFGIKWTYVHDRFGVVKITGYTSATQVTATVERRLPNSVTSVPTHRWSHGLFSAAAGWPQLVVLWRGRLWFIKDFDLCGSVAGSYRDFSEFNELGEVSDDQAIRLVMDLSNRPLWVRADRQSLIIGTALGEYAVGPRNPGEPISAGNLVVVPQSAHGSQQVFPIGTAAELIFVQRGGRKLRSAAYEFGQDRYIANNLTLYARQITVSGIVQLAYQAEREELLWALRADGHVVSHSYNPQQEVKGWADTLVLEGASVKSICTVPSPDAVRDDLWLLVERDGVLTIEQLEDWWDEDESSDASDGFFVDSGITYSGAAATVISGLDHLAALEVAILADGSELPLQTVNEDGEVTLATAASLVHVGLPYTARFTSLRPEIPKRDGTSQGRHKRVVRLVASLIDSFGVVAGSIGGKLDRLVRRGAAVPMGSGPDLFTGWTDDRAIGGGNDKDGRVTLEDRSPFPWILAAAVSQLTDGDK